MVSPNETRLHVMRTWCGVTAMMAAFMLTGCGTISSAMSAMSSLTSGLLGPRAIAPQWDRVVVTAAGDSNRNSPVALDIVFVRDQVVIDALLATSSGKWFSSRADLQRTFPEVVSVLSLELVPNQSMQIDRKVLQSKTGLAAILYADYPGPGEHRERLQLTASGYVVQLGASGFKVAEVNSRTASR